MARSKIKAEKPPLRIRSITLTTEVNETLGQLGQDASDALGWTVGGSAIIRALLQYAAQQPPAWAAATLHPMIEREIADGTVWGSKKK